MGIYGFGGLSMQELISQLYDKIEEVTNKTNDNVDYINDELSEFQGILDLMVSEGLSTEVANKFQSMYVNGDFTTLINQTIFNDLNTKIDNATNDIKTTLSTNIVDSVVPVNTLANSLDGASDIVVKGMSLVQLVKNGNFVNTVGWSVANGIMSANGNILSITGNGTNLYTQAIQSITGVWSNKKVFGKMLVRVTNANCTSITLRAFNGLTGVNIAIINNPIQNQWYLINGIATLDSGTGQLELYLRHTYVDNATANGKVMEVQNVMGLDLTSLGLVTKTADEINAMLNGYFEGIASVEGGTSVIKSVGENLFDKSTVVVGSYFSATGTLVADSVSEYSNQYIRIDKTKTYSWNGTTSSKQIIIVTYDINKNFLERIITYTGPIINSKLFNSNVAYIRISNYQRLNTFSLQDFIFNEGTVAKPYQPYKESKITLSDYIDTQYFPLRSVTTVSDECIGNKLYKRIGKIVLNGSESWVDSAVSNTNYITFHIPIQINSDVVLSDKFTYSTNTVIQTYESEGIKGSKTYQVLYIRASKTKATDVATFKTWLASNNVEVVYELSTPIEVTLDRKINLPIYKNGSIIQEPTKLYPKLSYSFPLNTGKTIESIVNSLAVLNYNQQFNSAYLFDLETRLSIIEGGL